MTSAVDRHRYAAWGQLDDVVAKMKSEYRHEVTWLLGDPERCTRIAFSFAAYRNEASAPGQSLSAKDLREGIAALEQVLSSLQMIRSVSAKMSRLQIPAENQGNVDLANGIAEFDRLASSVASPVADFEVLRLLRLITDIKHALPEGRRLGPGDAFQGSPRNRFVLDAAYEFDRVGLEILPKAPFGEFISCCICTAEDRATLNSSALYDLVKQARDAVASCAQVIGESAHRRKQMN